MHDLSRSLYLGPRVVVAACVVVGPRVVVAAHVVDYLSLAVPGPGCPVVLVEREAAGEGPAITGHLHMVGQQAGHAGQAAGAAAPVLVTAAVQAEASSI